MMNDGTIPKEVNQLPESSGSAGESPPPVINFSQTTESSRTAEPMSAQEDLSLRGTYAGRAARYRELGQKQLDGTLNPEEIREREDLGQMAGFGLFAADLSEDQLRAKDAVYQASIEAEAKELTDPQASAARYRELGTKLYDSGLTPEELAEYNRLKAYADRGKFELSQAA